MCECSNFTKTEIKDCFKFLSQEARGKRIMFTVMCFITVHFLISFDYNA